LVQHAVVGPRSTTVGSTGVLVVDEEFVETRKSAHPPDAEEARRWWRSDRRNEPGVVPERESCLSAFGQATPRAGQDESRPGERVVLPEGKVRREIACRPRIEQGWCVRSELVQRVAELRPFDAVDEHLGHIAGV